MYAPQHAAGQGQYPPPQWNGSPNPQQPYPHQHPGPQQPGSVYPPPTSQTANPYPPPPTNGAYPPPANYPPPPANGYPPPSHMPQTLPSIAQDPRADMQYRYPPHDMYRGAPPPHHLAPYPHPHQSQPAPRQRTAIACRYCRRRKIRCSGFEASEDGRCTNCVRFSQECIFTPVSAQTQAFVPAHTVRNYNNQYPQQLFGAYGQPLPPQHAPPQAGPHPPPQGYPLPSPTGPYSTSGAPHSPVVGAYDGREAGDATIGRKRQRADPHSPTLAPPNPALAASHAHPDHASSLPYRSHEYTYPEPTSLTQAAVSPASAHSPYHHAGAPPQATQPYYNQPPAQQAPPPRRTSPTNTSTTYDTRTSSSPNGNPAPSTPGSSISNYPPYTQQGRSPPPPGSQAPTSQPPSGQNTGANGANRAGLRITDMVNGEGGRSSADSNMLNALNRRPM